jgi:hypothetical protein
MQQVHMVKTAVTQEGGPEVQVRSSLKMTIFWDAAPFSLIQIDGCFRCAYCIHHQDSSPDDGGREHFLNIGQFLPDYMAQHPRRQSSSYSLL